jgi:hypothetical protein
VDETVKTNKIIAEVIGWYGMVAILSAYALLSFGMLSSDSITFQLLNLTGAIGIAAISLLKKTYQPAIVNIVWMFIAFVALIKILF